MDEVALVAKQKELELERTSLLTLLARVTEDLKENVLARELAERKAADIERKYVTLLEQNDSNHLKTIEELTRRNSLLEQENAELKLEISQLKTAMSGLQSEVSSLRNDLEAMKQEKKRKKQLFLAHDLLRLHNYYKLPVPWSTLTNEVSKIEKAIPPNISDVEYDQEFNNRVQLFLATYNLQNFPLLALQQIANARTKEGHTTFRKTDEQYAFLQSITSDSFSELSEESRNALALLQSRLQGVAFRRMN